MGPQYSREFSINECVKLKLQFHIRNMNQLPVEGRLLTQATNAISVQRQSIVLEVLPYRCPVE